MGRVRTKTVKRAAKELIEKYYFKLSEDFHMNKKILNAVSDVSTKRLRNKIAGYTVHLIKRIQKGPVKGISLKMQEEQKERLMDQLDDEPKVKPDLKDFEVNDPTLKMLKEVGLGNLIKNKNVVGRSKFDK